MDEEMLRQFQLLIQSVQTLGQTQEAMIRRQDQLFSQFSDMTTKLLQVVETLEATNEALLESLNENDSNLDDLATISAGLTQVSAQLKSFLPASQQQESSTMAG
jgi:DNA anti-recombination protein RmuC